MSAGNSCYLFIQAIALNFTIHYYHVTQKDVRQILTKLEQLHINWDNYEYLIFDNLQGRARPGHALKYIFKIDKRLIINNQETEDLPNIDEELTRLRDQDISYILIDFSEQIPQIRDEYMGLKD